MSDREDVLVHGLGPAGGASEAELPEIQIEAYLISGHENPIPASLAIAVAGIHQVLPTVVQCLHEQREVGREAHTAAFTVLEFHPADIAPVAVVLGAHIGLVEVGDG